MSEVERQRGSLFKIGLPNRQQWTDLSFEEQITFLRSRGYAFDEVDIPSEYAHCDELIYFSKQWWRIVKEEVRADDFALVEKTSEGMYVFDCAWYNGGGSLEEVLESAFDEAQVKQTLMVKK